MNTATNRERHGSWKDCFIGHKSMRVFSVIAQANCTIQSEECKHSIPHLKLHRSGRRKCVKYDQLRADQEFSTSMFVAKRQRLPEPFPVGSGLFLHQVVR